MKQIFVVIAFLLAGASFTVNAQIRKIPAAVTDAFKAKYPNAESVEFKDKLTSFQVSFLLNGVSHQAKFTSKGEWEQTEKAMEEAALPAAVKEGFGKSKYTEWEVAEVTWIQYSDNHIEYRIYVKKNAIEKKYLFFDESGKMLRDAIKL